MKPMPKTWPAPVAEGGGAPFGARTPNETARGPEEWPNGDVPEFARAGSSPFNPVPIEIKGDYGNLGTIRTTSGRAQKRGR
jgi:hypothetical protein